MTALLTRGACVRGVELEHGWVTVFGLPEDRVRVGAGPERLGDEPRPQRVPTEPGDLSGGEAGGGRAAGGGDDRVSPLVRNKRAGVSSSEPLRTYNLRPS